MVVWQTSMMVDLHDQPKRCDKFAQFEFPISKVFYLHFIEFYANYVGGDNLVSITFHNVHIYSEVNVYYSH